LNIFLENLIRRADIITKITFKGLQPNSTTTSEKTAIDYTVLSFLEYKFIKKSMWWFLIIIAGFFIIRFLLNFNRDRFVTSKWAYHSAPEEIRILIDMGAAEELAELLVNLEKEGFIKDGSMILDAINSKGIAFATKVDRFRSPLREAAGLGKLKMFN
jgi:hypothetical protein